MQPSALAPAAALQAAVEAGQPIRGSGASTPVGGGGGGMGGGGKRQRSTVNYAELGQISDADDDDTDDPRSKRGVSGVPGMQPKKSLVEGQLQMWGDGKSYLGVLPPANMVTVQPAVKTKHAASYVTSPADLARLQLIVGILTYSTEEQLEDLAEIPAAFVPIQIDLDYKTFKIRDSFVWNVNGMLSSASTPGSDSGTRADIARRRREIDYSRLFRSNVL